jgi:DNA-binding SARP family transcriptional activator
MPFSLLGPLAVQDGTGRPLAIPGAKARALLAMLLTHVNRPVAIERLEDELWDGAPPRAARATVHAHVSRLRSVLKASGSAATLTAGAGSYALHVDDHEVDARRFEALVAQGSRALAHDPWHASDLLTRALDQWRGPALHDVRHLASLSLEAHRLDELRLATIESRMSAELATGAHLIAVGSLQRLVDEHPYRERLRELLMLALYRCGRRVEALRAYQAACHSLAEIGVTPGRELTAMERSIVVDDPELLALDRPEVRVAASHDGDHRPDDHAALAAKAFEQAAALSARAGDDALLRLGFDDAALHYRGALTALELQPASPMVRRAELLVALGRACHGAYQLEDALDAFRRAAGYAAQLGDIHLLADAAAGAALASEFCMADDELVGVLTHVLAALPEDVPVRIDLLAGLARSLPSCDPRARATAQHAVALARRLDAPRSLLIALATAILVTWSATEANHRLADIDEVIDAANALEWSELTMEARGWRAATLDQLGRGGEAAVERSMIRAWAERSRRPFFLTLAAMLTIGEDLSSGSLEMADRALAHLPASAAASPNFSAAFAAQLFLLRRAQGRVEEFIPLLDSLALDDRAPAAWQAARVVALAETGHPAALGSLRDAASRLSTAPDDWLWLATVALLADACVELADPDVAPALHDRLWPHRHEVVVVAHGIANLGPVGPRLEALARLTRSRASELVSA